MASHRQDAPTWLGIPVVSLLGFLLPIVVIVVPALIGTAIVEPRVIPWFVIAALLLLALLISIAIDSD